MAQKPMKPTKQKRASKDIVKAAKPRGSSSKTRITATESKQRGAAKPQGGGRKHQDEKP